MIGSLHDAEAALAGTLEYLDSGSARAVFRSGNVVYKTEIERGSNGIEWDNYLEYADMSLPENIRIPQTALFYCDKGQVIAMEYISGQPLAACYCIPGIEDHMPDCMSEDERDLISRYMTDISGHNVIRTDEGIYYLIDFDAA